MLQAVEKRFAAVRAPHAIKYLSDNGSAYTTKATRYFATALNQVTCFTMAARPQSNGRSIRKNQQRDYVRINPLPDGKSALSQITGWIEDYNPVS